MSALLTTFLVKTSKFDSYDLNLFISGMGAGATLPGCQVSMTGGRVFSRDVSIPPRAWNELFFATRTTCAGFFFGFFCFFLSPSCRFFIGRPHNFLVSTWLVRPDPGVLFIRKLAVAISVIRGVDLKSRSESSLRLRRARRRW